MNKLIMAGYALFLTLIAGVTFADTQQVDDPRELADALKSAKAGSIIELAPGAYGSLSMRRFNVGGMVTLRSANPKKPAQFSEMKLREVNGLILEGILFDYTAQKDDPLHLRPFQVINSANITIRDSVFDGDVARGRGNVDDGFATAFGLGVQSSKEITLKNNEVHTFYRGIVISQTGGVMVTGNNIHKLRMDGLNFAEVTDVRIQSNHIHDFVRPKVSEDHADMIQFWTRGTNSPSRNIVIRDNILNSGQGLYTQSIFMRNGVVDRGQAGLEMFYKNITIENNLIINAHLHGITMGETNGLKIRNNTVVRNARSKGERDIPGLWIPQIRIAETSRDVDVSRNITHRIVGVEQQPDWRVRDNFIVQDQARMKAGFYGRVFGQKALHDPTRATSFRPKAGGDLEGVNVGAQGLFK